MHAPLEIAATAADERWTNEAVRFSISTLVSNWTQYAAMTKSFAERGFSASDCEFLYLDNSSGNRFDAYRGINNFLGVARGGPTSFFAIRTSS